MLVTLSLHDVACVLVLALESHFLCAYSQIQQANGAAVTATATAEKSEKDKDTTKLTVNVDADKTHSNSNAGSNEPGSPMSPDHKDHTLPEAVHETLSLHDHHVELLTGEDFKQYEPEGEHAKSQGGAVALA